MKTRIFFIVIVLMICVCGGVLNVKAQGSWGAISSEAKRRTEGLSPAMFREKSTQVTPPPPPQPVYIYKGKPYQTEAERDRAIAIDKKAKEARIAADKAKKQREIEAAKAAQIAEKEKGKKRNAEAQQSLAMMYVVDSRADELMGIPTASSELKFDALEDDYFYSRKESATYTPESVEPVKRQAATQTSRRPPADSKKTETTFFDKVEVVKIVLDVSSGSAIEKLFSEAGEQLAAQMPKYVRPLIEKTADLAGDDAKGYLSDFIEKDKFKTEVTRKFFRTMSEEPVGKRLKEFVEKNITTYCGIDMRFWEDLKEIVNIQTNFANKDFANMREGIDKMIVKGDYTYVKEYWNKLAGIGGEVTNKANTQVSKRYK